MNNETTFRSALANSLQGFINEKRAVGYEFNKGISMLQRFDSYLCSLPQHTEELTKYVVLQWTERKPFEAVSTQAGRISLMRGLAEYMTRIGKTAYIYPRSLVTVDRYSYTPYIFSEKEIASIFFACDSFPASKESPHRHLILSLILRMLYGCGLRISEAVNLTIADVNLNEGTLYIRDTKFGKERVLPMADTLNKRCRDYSILVLKGKPDTSYFFPSPFGGHYNSNTIYGLFREIIWTAGISYGLFREIIWTAGISHTGKGPRLHDLSYPNLNKIQTFFKKAGNSEDFYQKRFGFFSLLFH